MAIDATKVAKVKTAMDNRYENKQSNKKTDISGSFTGDTDSYPTAQAVKDYVSSQGYLTEHQSISGKVDIAQGSGNASKNVVTDASGNITVEAKPTIPTKVSDLTNDSGFLTSHQDISGKLDISQTSYKGKNVVVDDTTGDITFENKPTIPTKVSDLTNDSGFLTEHQSLAGKLSIAQGSSNASLNVVTDSNGDITFEAKPTIPTKVSDLTNDSGFLTAHQSLSDIGGAVTVVEKTSPNSGAFKTYQIKQGGTAVSGEIDIPKDFLVKSGSVKTVGSTPSSAETAEGLTTGQKYISLIVNTKDSTSSSGDTELIIPANSLVDTYTADNTTMQLSNNQFSVKAGGIGTTQLSSGVTTSLGYADAFHNLNITSTDVENWNAKGTSNLTTSDVDSEINQALDDLAELIYPTNNN